VPLAPVAGICVRPGIFRALRLRVPMDRVGPNIGLVGHQPVKDVDALIGATGKAMAEQRDELVGHMVVAYATVAAIADLPCCLCWQERYAPTLLTFNAAWRKCWAVESHHAQDRQKQSARQ